MDLHELEYFIAIAESENMSKAAEKLFISQSALSQFLGRTEKKLGIKLFLRSKDNSLKLSEAGMIYKKACQNILSVWNQAEQDLISLQLKKIQNLSFGVVTQEEARWLSEVLLDVRAQNPHSHIDIQAGLPSILQDKVLRGELHVGFSAYNKKLSQLDYRMFSRKEIELLVPTQHKLAQYSYKLPGQENLRIPLDKIETSPVVLLNKNTILRQIEDEWFGSMKFYPNVKASVANIGATAPFISSGEYLGLLPQNSINCPNAVPVALESPAYYEIGAYRRKDLFQSDILDDIIERYAQKRLLYTSS